MFLWEVLVTAKPDYDRAKSKGNVLEWLADRLPLCFVRTTDGKSKFIEEPHDWQEVQKTFDANYDVLFRLAKAHSQSTEATPEKRKRRVRLISPADEPTIARALRNLRLIVMIDLNNDSELGFQFSGDYYLHGTFYTLEEFWQVAFLSLYRPELLPWRGSYCADCGRPMPPTKKKRKASGTKFCSGCRVRKSRQEAKRKTQAKSTSPKGA